MRMYKILPILQWFGDPRLVVQQSYPVDTLETQTQKKLTLDSFII